MKKEKLVTVFRTKKSAVLSVAKSMLDEAGIIYKTQSEQLQTPESGYPIEILVFDTDEKAAVKILSYIDKAEDLINYPLGHPRTKSDQYYSTMTIAVISVIALLILLTILLIRC